MPIKHEMKTLGVNYRDL